MERRLAKIYLENGVELNGSPFVVKTFQLLHDAGNADCAHWNTPGDSFIVSNTHLFSTRLPKYFKHCNFSSFVRQLNTYGFRKLGSSEWEFRHDLFRRDAPHLLSEIRHRGRPKRERDDGEEQDNPPASMLLAAAMPMSMPMHGPSAAAAAAAFASLVNQPMPSPSCIFVPPSAAPSSLADIRLSSMEPGFSRRFDSEAIRTRDAEIRRLSDINGTLQTENERLKQLCEAKDRINRLLLTELSRCASSAEHTAVLTQLAAPFGIKPKDESLVPPQLFSSQFSAFDNMLSPYFSSMSDSESSGAESQIPSPQLMAQTHLQTSLICGDCSPSGTESQMSMLSQNRLQASPLNFSDCDLSAIGPQMPLLQSMAPNCLQTSPVTFGECDSTGAITQMPSPQMAHKRRRLSPINFGPIATVDDFNVQMEHEMRSDKLQDPTFNTFTFSGIDTLPALSEEQQDLQPASVWPVTSSNEGFQSLLTRLGTVYHNPLI
eukprot:TRINITY_DN7002_c0_g1_i2.p1 TRINITY_DN7002_c0_g1~~TRINITY_DN7002_c0_g1_i2.p1  ORF type:complete len:525 (+),score=28.10 TRINITY_DN7002_c0_g1_i2:109-1575(+)